MSNKDNWDDETSDEEDPLLKDDGMLRFKLDTVNAIASEPPMEYDAVEFVNETGAEDEGPLDEGADLPDDDDYDDDYDDDDDDYDDEIDKKLGRYVSCR